MIREEFIKQYYEEIGEYPSEEIIRHYLGDDYEDGSTLINQYRQDHKYSRALSSNNDDLLFEIRDIVSSISGSARTTLKNGKSTVINPTQSKELHYMIYIFLAKTCLYFLFKNSIDDGFDFRNI